MCDECKSIDERIVNYRKFLSEPFDALTIARVKETIQLLESRKDTMHSVLQFRSKAAP
jgi:hypothetical protein